MTATALLERPSLPSVAAICDPAPRLYISPPEAGNAADEVVGFYHSFGRRLDYWQQLSLRVGLGENADGTWTCFECGVIVQRQNGKGVITEALTLAALFLWGLKVIIYTAHHGDTVKKAFLSMKQLIEDNPDLARRCKPINDSDEAIETLTGCRLEFKTRTGRRGRGLTGDLLIFDEALELREDQTAAIAPILLAVPHAQVWYTSTVPLHADQHLVKARANAVAGEPRMAWIEWGVDDSEARLNDPVELAKANPALRSGRLTLERIADLRRLLGDEKFRTECMGIWPGTAQGSALDQRKFERMRDPASHRGPDAAAVFSIDVTPMLDWGTIGMWALREDGLEHVQVVDSRPGILWIPDRAAELRREIDPLAWAIDAKNGAMELLEPLAEAGITAALIYEEDEDTGKTVAKPRPPSHGEIVILQTDDAAKATVQFIQAFQGEVMRWPGKDEPDDPQLPLKLAVANVKTRPIGDRGQIAWARRSSTVNIGAVVTITQSRYVYYTWHDVISSEYNVLDSIPLADGQCPYCEAWSVDGPISHYEDCVTLKRGALARG